MRILHITAEALRGGCEKNCYHFIKGSTVHHHEVMVLGTSGPMSEEWLALDVRVTHLEILSRGLTSFRNHLKNSLSGTSYDLVICWSTVRLPLQLNALKGIAETVKVYLGNPVGPGYRPLKDKLLKLLYSAPSHVTLMACSQYVKQSHQATNYFNSFPINVSLNPVPLPANYVAERSSMPGFRCGMVARLDPIKDHKTVIKGFARVYRQIPGAQLHIVGDGSLRKELTLLADELGVLNVTVFHGDVPDVYARLDGLHTFVYATTLQEGLGSVVAEAMANGLPCLLSDLPMLRELAPMPDLVQWFAAGDEKEFGDKLLELANDTRRRDSLGKAAFDYAHNHFGVNRFIQDYLNDR